jgi:hypothetical protein
MGSFINNIHIYGRAEQAVAGTLRAAIKAPAYQAVSGPNWISVYPAESEILQDLAQKLSSELSTGVFAIVVHDDLLHFIVFEHGMMVDEFNSNLRYFTDTMDNTPDDDDDAEADGNPAIILKYALPGTPIGEVAETLEEIKLEVLARHGVISLAHLLGIDDACARASSRDIKRGDVIPGVTISVVTPE